MTGAVAARPHPPGPRRVTTEAFPRRRFITVTPFGAVFVVAEGSAFTGCYFLNATNVPADMGIWAHPADPVLEEAACQLGEYATGQRRTFDLPLAITGNAFTQRVWHKICQIPYGKTATYGQIAASLGNRHMARAVGQAVAANPWAIVIPCHRVVAENGLGGYVAGSEVKRALLAHEGWHAEADIVAQTEGQDLLF